MKNMVAEMGIKPGEILQREKIFEWFKRKYPKIKDGTIHAHLGRMSINVRTRIHYHANPNGDDDLFYRIDPSRYRLYDPSHDPAPIYKDMPGIPPERQPERESGDIAPEDGSTEFAYEHDLQSYLSKNLNIIEPGLKLFEDDEGTTGVEFPAGDRRIDLLAVDKNNNYVVIELKVSRGYDRVVGQLLRYMAWVEKHQADTGQSVRGIIIAKEITDDLVLATSRVKDVDLFEYEMSVSLKKINKA
jgi:hypothetical protein